MSVMMLETLASRVNLNIRIVWSWFEQNFFNDVETGVKFFEEHREIIQAKPFIKRVGGKRQLIEQFKDLFPKPKEFANYHEPFLGGGAVFFNLQKKQSYLSDVNEELINVYKVIKKHPEKLIHFLKTLEYSKEVFLEIRSWDREENWQEKYTKVQRAGRFIYLNRTCFNGENINSEEERK